MPTTLHSEPPPVIHSEDRGHQRGQGSSTRPDLADEPAASVPEVVSLPRRARQRIGAIVARLPAAQVLLPLAAGSSLSTWAPGLLHLGPFTHAAATSSSTCIVLLLVAVGAQLQLGVLKPIASRIAIILTGATLIPGAGVVAYGLTFGRPGVAGVPLLSVAAAGMCTSNGLWISLARRHGSPADAASGAIASILNSGPLLPLVALALAGRRGVAGSGRPLVDALLPLLVGVIAGAVWPAARKALQPVIPVAVIMLSFALGTTVHLTGLTHQLRGGLLLGATVCVISGGLVAAGWALVVHQPAALGLAASAITLAAPAIPGMVAWSDQTWRAQVSVATAQVSIAMILSTIAAPLLVATFTAFRRRARRHPLATPHSDRWKPPCR